MVLQSFHQIIFSPSTHFLVYLFFWAALKATPQTAHEIALPFLFCNFCSLNTTFMHLTTTSGLDQFSFAYSVPRGIGKALHSLNLSKSGSSQALTFLGQSWLAAAWIPLSCWQPIEHPCPEFRGRVVVSQTDSFNHSILPGTPKMWCLTLKRKGAHEIHKCSWLKGRTKARGSTETHEVLLVNYTLHMEIDALIPVLLYKNTADINTQQWALDEEVRWKVREKERKKGRKRAKEITGLDSKAKQPNFS